MINPDGSQHRETQEILMERRHVILGMAAASLLPVAGQTFAQGNGIEKDKLNALCNSDKRACGD
jgi:hypothetical protein